MLLFGNNPLRLLGNNPLQISCAVQLFRDIQTTILALVKLIEKVEEIKKNIRPWVWGPHVFKLQRFDGGGAYNIVTGNA